jgi:HEAT repeat protein
MMCIWAKERIAASWTGELEGHEQTKLRSHLAECQECAAEMMQLSAMWERLADIPAPEPSLAMQVRWDATIESLGVQKARQRRPEAWKFSLAALWPNRPVWQVTVAAACLVLGLAVGSNWSAVSRQTNKSETAALREEVASTKEMVALSLLKEQSASERLRGVDYSTQMPRIEPGVISALIQAVNQDPSVNVRLAAIDALSRASGQPQVRQSLEQSLNRQESPTVQAALIGYLVDARDKQAVGALRQFATRPDLDQTVRERAGRATQQLTQFR